MRKLLMLSLSLAVFAAVAVADDKKDDKSKQEATITPTQLAVTSKVDQKLFPYAMSDSTNVMLLVRFPGKQLLGVDQSSKLDSLKDDKGTSLIDDKSFFKANFNTYPQIAKDRSAMLVNVNAFNRRPGKGASKVVVKGELVVLHGTEEKKAELKKFEFKAKAEEKFGDFTLKVTREKDGFGAEGPALELIGKTKDIKSISIKDADDKELEVDYRGSYGGGESFVSTYAVRKAVKEGKVVVTFFSKSEKIKVPVDVSIGINLGE